MNDVDLEDLTKLIMDPDLETLEKLLDPFNIFEAIGMTRQEVRHSNFLAFLLNPRQNHGLGDVFLKRLLQKALLGSSGNIAGITPIDIDLWSFDQVLVRVEHLNIDILLVDETNELAIIIENKIGTGEHDKQLDRYQSSVTQRYPKCKRIIGLYLTPDGATPSDKERYIPVDYNLVRGILADISRSRASTLGADVLTAINHYTQLLGRHIVEDSEVVELCRRIYQKHQPALDLIFESRPDRQSEIKDILENLIKKEPDLILRAWSKKIRIPFGIREWDEVSVQHNGSAKPLWYVPSFQFENRMEKDKPSLTLYLLTGGTGRPQETSVELQQKLKSMSDVPKSILQAEKPNVRWPSLYSRTFLKPEDYMDADIDDLETKIKMAWTTFLAEDLPEIQRTIREERWTWVLNESYSIEKV